MGEVFRKAWKYAIEELHKVGDDVAKLPLPLATVVRVHTAQGIIDNGGFRYFFESDIDGKTSYDVIVEDYQRIGADIEAETVAEALQFFPFENPHLDCKRRQECMGLFGEEAEYPEHDDFEPLNDIMWNGSENVWRLLERFIEKHAEHFPTLTR